MYPHDTTRTVELVVIFSQFDTSLNVLSENEQSKNGAYIRSATQNSFQNQTPLQTKICIPPSADNWIARIRLDQKLEEGFGHKLTLVSAPAGFGKTTLLIDWINRCHIPVTWISLDKGDNDILNMLSNFIFGLQQMEDDIGMAFAEAKRISTKAGNIYYQVFTGSCQCSIMIMRCKFQEATEICEQSLDVAIKNYLEQTSVAGSLYSNLGIIRCESNALDQGLDLLHKGVEVSKLGCDSVIVASCGVNLLRRLSYRLDFAGALNTMEMLRQCARDFTLPPWITNSIATIQVFLWLEGGNLDALKTALSLAEPDSLIMIFVSKGKPVAYLLEEMLSHNKQEHDVAKFGFSWPYARKILAAYQTISPAKNDQLPDPISARELEVLRLMAAGLSNREIGDKLFISLNTVKTHTKNINRKLDVGSRIKAVIRAKALNLI